MNRMVLVALTAAALLVACGGTAASPPSDAGSPTAGGTPASGSALGPGISVAEARASDTDQPLLVNGYLVAEADVVRLCSALAESLPPQCGEPSLEVVGVDLDNYPTRSAAGVTWTQEQVQVLGEVDGSVLRARPDAAG